MGIDIRPLRMPLVKPKSTPKLPVTVAILSHLARVIDFTRHQDRTLWAMMTLATYGLLRCAEVTRDPIDKGRFLHAAPLEYREGRDTWTLLPPPLKS